MTLVSTFGNAKVRFLSEKKEFYSRKVSLMTKIGNRNRLLCGFTFKTSYNSSQKYWDVSGILHIHSRKLTHMSKIGNMFNILVLSTNRKPLPLERIELWSVAWWQERTHWGGLQFCRHIVCVSPSGKDSLSQWWKGGLRISLSAG